MIGNNLMDKLTLDTNVLRDWAWCEGLTQEVRYGNDPAKRHAKQQVFAKIQLLRDRGYCELGITTQIYTDFEKTVGELPDYIEKMIDSYVEVSVPSISTVPMKLPTVIVNEKIFYGILQDVFPNTRPQHRKYCKNRKDALQLYAHYVAERDFFLTSDHGILNKKNILHSKWDIIVLSPEDYIAMKTNT